MRSADHIVDMGPGAGEHGGEVVASGSLAGHPGRSRVPSPAVPVRRAQHPRAGGTPRGTEQLRGPRGPRAQPQEHRRGRAHGSPRVRHRRLRLGQVVAGERHHLSQPFQPGQSRPDEAGRPRSHRRHRAVGQGHQHRPVAHRPHAALQPGHLHRAVRPHPRALLSDPGVEGARLRPGTVQLQRQGGALRGLQGRRHPQDRDAFPARRLRALRGLPGQALHAGDPGGALQGQERGRSARHERGGGGGVLRQPAQDQAPPADPGRRGARATSSWASRPRPSPAAKPSG